jgi:flagellar biosynthetic protein FlhB
MADDSNKSEKATPYKLKEAQKKGQVSKSAEISGLLMFIVFSATLLIMGQGIWEGLIELTTKLIGSAGKLSVTNNTIFVVTFDLITKVVELFSSLIVVLILGAIFFNIIQTGPVLSSEPISPDWKKLNPVEGFKKLFAKKTLFDLFKALLKVGTVYLVWMAVGQSWLDTIMDSYGMSISGFTNHWVASTVTLCVLLFCILLPMALLDLAFTKWDFAKKMMMSQQDVKDEHKKREGDPQVKQKQKQIQKELLKKSASLKSVKDADVIITNPEHIAVALSFVPNKMLAPKILSMGEDNNAAIIRKIARTHNVPIIRNIKLARKLYKGSVIDGYIPESCYAEVASIFKTILGLDKPSSLGQHS